MGTSMFLISSLGLGTLRPHEGFLSGQGPVARNASAGGQDEGDLLDGSHQKQGRIGSTLMVCLLFFIVFICFYCSFFCVSILLILTE